MNAYFFDDRNSNPGFKSRRSHGVSGGILTAETYHKERWQSALLPALPSLKNNEGRPQSGSDVANAGRAAVPDAQYCEYCGGKLAVLDFWGIQYCPNCRFHAKV